MKQLFRVQTGSAPEFCFLMETYQVQETGDFAPEDDQQVQIKSSSPSFVHEGVVYEVAFALALGGATTPPTMEQKMQRPYATLDTIQPIKGALPSPGLELWTFSSAFANSFSFFSTFLRATYSRGEKTAEEKARKAFHAFMGSIGIHLPFPEGA